MHVITDTGLQEFLFVMDVKNAVTITFRLYGQINMRWCLDFTFVPSHTTDICQDSF